MYLSVFITGYIPHWPALLHPYSTAFPNVHAVRLWTFLLIIGWIRLVIFVKLTNHIFIDIDSKTRMVVKSDGVFRISSLRILTLVIFYEVPMSLIQRFLVEKYVVYSNQVLKLFLQCVTYIFLTCHFMSLKKFHWCSTRWGSKRSYYVLALMPVLISCILLFRIGLLNTKLRFADCIQFEKSREGLLIVSTELKRLCLTKYEIVFLSLCIVSVVLIVAIGLLYIVKTKSTIPSRRSFRHAMWLG